MHNAIVTRHTEPDSMYYYYSLCTILWLTIAVYRMHNAIVFYVVCVQTMIHSLCTIVRLTIAVLYYRMHNAIVTRHTEPDSVVPHQLIVTFS